MKTLGQRIQELRTAADMTQEMLGEKLDTTRQTVSRWELDQALPTLDRIVRMSRLFSVTTDSLLVEGISTFRDTEGPFLCGVYRDGCCEIVETERFAYVIAGDDKGLYARLYTGSRENKRLQAICVRDMETACTGYAWRTEEGVVYANDDALAGELGAAFDRMQLGRMRRRETFWVDHSGRALPSVSDAGIRRCLAAWRMSDSCSADETHFHFFLCTGVTEYVFTIRPEQTDIYCGASFNIPFDMGLMSGGQYFRLRNCGDNSQPWCGFLYDFDYLPRRFDIPTQEIQPGLCVSTSEGLMWCVKRYTEEEIVLQGCGDDEYIYRRHDRRTEQFTAEADK